MNGYYGTQGPAEWAQQKQGQQYNTLQNMINMLMRVKMMKHEEGLRREETEREEQWKQDVMRPYYEARTSEMRQPKQRTQYEIQQEAILSDPNIPPEEKNYFLQRGELPKPKKPLPKTVDPGFDAFLSQRHGPKWRETMLREDFDDWRDFYQGKQTDKKPTDREERWKLIDLMVTKKQLTPEEANQLKVGISLSKQVDYSGPQGETGRNRNETRVAGIINSIDDKYAPSKAKNVRNMMDDLYGGIPDARPEVGGIFLDMPQDYNVALLNKVDGVATPKDLDTIKKYDDWFKYFQLVSNPDSAKANGMIYAPTFKDWLRLRVKNIDRVYMKKWYDIYR
uniref:Uncharacterized protein n=1 Tax=viral metagenome TaxID=1070528 RepID=A0A6M3IRR3_9ZZZZ